MTENPNDRVPCAHYTSRYLPLTQNWIYRVMINHQRFIPVLFSRKKENLHLFPLPEHFSLDDFGRLRQYIEIMFFKLYGYFNFIRKIANDKYVRILHVHFGYHGVKMIGLKKKLNIPMVCSFYGDDAYAWPYKPGNRKRYVDLFTQADKILVLGRYMKSEIVALGCPENKVCVHHLGIDVDKIHFKKRSVGRGNEVRFLIASSFVKKKGIDLAIRALSACKDYDFTLDIIGDGPLRNEILSIIDNSDIKNRITLHGYKPYDYFIALAIECDVFIQASRTTENNNKEGTPMAIVDAMATGMAVVSTQHSDIPEIVLDGQTGYLADENNLQSLEMCIRKILDEPGKIETFSRQAREWIEQEFDAKKQTLKLEEYYTALILQYTSPKTKAIL